MSLYDSLLHRLGVYICVMKLVQLILALYIVVLSALPCKAFRHEDEPASVAAQLAAPDSEDCADEGWCSPFCLCATCPGFTVPQSPQFVASIQLGVSISVLLLPHYQAPPTFDVFGRIWQPPRLG